MCKLLQFLSRKSSYNSSEKGFRAIGNEARSFNERITTDSAPLTSTPDSSHKRTWLLPEKLFLMSDRFA
jgi:hypothetical protein